MERSSFEKEKINKKIETGAVLKETARGLSHKQVPNHFNVKRSLEQK